MKNPTAALDPFRPFGPLQVFYVEPLMPFRWPMDSFPMAGYGLVVSMCWKSTLNRMTPIERVVLERTADRRCFGDLSALVLGRCFPDHDMFASAKIEFLAALAPQSYWDYWVCSKSSDPPKDSLNFPSFCLALSCIMVMALTVPLNDAPERIRGWSMMCGLLGRSPDVPPRDKMVQHPRHSQ